MCRKQQWVTLTLCNRSMTKFVAYCFSSSDVVGNVTASDNDSGFNGIFDYNIVHGENGMFYITTTNTVGNIHVGGRLDKEKAPENGYILNITVQDRGSPPKSTDCLVKIEVIDVNDENPVFDPDQELKFSISEGLKHSPCFFVIRTNI